MPRDLSSIALVWLRTLKGWTQSDLAAQTGLQQSQISAFERQGLKRSRLEELAAAAGFSPSEVDLALLAIESLMAPPDRSPEPADPGVPTAEMARWSRRVTLRIAIQVADLARGKWLARMAHDRLTADRAEAERLWQRLKAWPPLKRRLVVEHSREFQIWSLAERLAEESARAAPKNAATALELSHLGVRAAQQAAGSVAWRMRLEGYARAFQANALRVQGSLARAKAEWETVRDLWHAGATGDPAGVLPAWRLFDLEASLLRDARKFDSALELLDRAAEHAPETAIGRILLKRASTLEQAGNPTAAVAVLRDAEPLVLATGDTRLQWLLAFNLAVNLYHLDHFTEVAARLPELRRRTLEMGNDLDVLRVQWLGGRVSAATGNREDARSALAQVRDQLASRRDGFGTAMVSLELAVLDLEDGRLAQVRRLAVEMSWIFLAEGVDREALAALRLFCEAACRQAATVKQAQAVLRLLGPLPHLSPHLP